MNPQNSAETVRDCLGNSSGKIVIIGHPSPDGDSLGSIAGLYHILNSRGIEAIPVASGPLPERYRFITQGLPFVPAPVRVTGATVVVLDCGDQKRLQEIGQSLKGAEMVINIDHHQDNSMFGGINYVDTTAAATALIIWEIFGGDIPCQATEPLFTGIYTDTGRFSYGNTDARVLEAAAKLVNLGARPPVVFRAVYEELSSGYLAFLSQALGKIQFHQEGRLALLEITRAELADSSVAEWELDNIIDYPRAVAGVEVSAILREAEGKIRVSFRSRDRVNVAALAANLGGGGHNNAAGATLGGSLAEAKALVLELMISSLED